MLRNVVDTLQVLWTNESGAVVTSELVMVTTVTVLGLIAGLTELRDSVNTELRDLSHSIQSIDPNTTGFASAAPVSLPTDAFAPLGN